MLDPVSLGVSDLERSRCFYDAALRPLAIVRLGDFELRGSDYGVGEAPLGVEFTITRETNVVPARGMHLCLKAKDRQSVLDFYTAALGAGGSCDGEPGARPLYHADYFAAFVLDPDGHRIEAVCHAQQESHEIVMNFQSHQVAIRRA